MDYQPITLKVISSLKINLSKKILSTKVYIRSYLTQQTMQKLKH